MTRITRRTAKPSPRAAAQKANFNRRERDATYIHLDKVLERNMGAVRKYVYPIWQTSD
jgi:hypothetical protein